MTTRARAGSSFGSHLRFCSFLDLICVALCRESFVCTEVKRENVDETEIALAFPLPTDSFASFVPAPQPVFAFLPVRSFGFK